MTLEPKSVNIGVMYLENRPPKALDARASSRSFDVATSTSPTTTPTTTTRPNTFARRARRLDPPGNAAATTCVRENSANEILFLNKMTCLRNDGEITKCIFSGRAFSVALRLVRAPLHVDLIILHLRTASLALLRRLPVAGCQLPVITEEALVGRVQKHCRRAVSATP